MIAGRAGRPMREGMNRLRLLAGFAAAALALAGPLHASDFETAHWTVIAGARPLPEKELTGVLEGQYEAWKTKTGAGTGAKLKLQVCFDRTAFHALPHREGRTARIDGTLFLLWDPAWASALSMAGPAHFLETAYPALSTRNDVPPWVTGGLSLYLAGVRGLDGNAMADPLVGQCVHAAQTMIRAGEWTSLERSLKLEGRDYEARRRLVDLQGWAVFYAAFTTSGVEGAAAVPSLLADLEAGKKADEAIAAFHKALGAASPVALEKIVRDPLSKLKVESKTREEEEWWVGETVHYAIRVQKGANNRKTRATDRQILEDLKSRMELVFEKYSTAFRFQGFLAERATLRLYKDRAAYQAAGSARDTAAGYSPASRELVAYEDSAEEGKVFQVLCHEGCHQFFDLAFPGFYDTDAIPMWFSEGLADGFGASELRGKELHVFTLGGTASWRIDEIKNGVQQGRTAPLRTLLDLGREPFMKNADLNYAQSWSFVHFLWNSPGLEPGRGQYSEIVLRLIDGFKAGKPRDQVYKEAFQLKGKPVSVDDLEVEWKAYVRTLKARGK